MMEKEKTIHHPHPMRRQREFEKPVAQKEINEIDFDTRKKIEAKVGEELMDMDNLAKSLYSYMPSTSSEMLYRMQLNTNIKVYSVFMVMGLLMVFAVLLFL